MPSGGKPSHSVISSSQSFPILRIAIPTPLRRCFDYLPPKQTTEETVLHIKPGMRVVVPFGRSQKVGVILEVCESTTVARDKLKRVHEVLDEEPVFAVAQSQHLLELMQWASRYYQHAIGESLMNALPQALRQGKAIVPGAV